MDAPAILGLMSDLYAQVSRLTTENAMLTQENARLTALVDPAPRGTEHDPLPTPPFTPTQPMNC